MSIYLRPTSRCYLDRLDRCDKTWFLLKIKFIKVYYMPTLISLLELIIIFKLIHCPINIKLISHQGLEVYSQ